MRSEVVDRGGAMEKGVGDFITSGYIADEGDSKLAGLVSAWMNSLRFGLL